MELKILQIREAQGDIYTDPGAIAKSMEMEAKADRECFWVLHLNNRNQVIEKELVSMGILDSSLVHPREVFRKACINSSISLITVHNHPSRFNSRFLPLSNRGQGWVIK